MVEQGKDIWSIVAKVRNGNATPEDVRILEKWLNECKENRLFYHVVNRIVRLREQDMDETNREYHFDNDSLVSMTTNIECNLHVNLRIASMELCKEYFYGLFMKTPNMIQLLDVMNIHNNFIYSVQNNTIFIHKN